MGTPEDVAAEKHFTPPNKGKIHMQDPGMPKDIRAPLCTVCLGLLVTNNPSEVTCKSCLRMLERRRKWQEKNKH